MARKNFPWRSLWWRLVVSFVVITLVFVNLHFSLNLSYTTKVELSLDGSQSQYSYNYPGAFDKSKPYFVFHVGPPKTATTTIQCDLQNLALDLAVKDSYYFLGNSCGCCGGVLLENNETSIKGFFLWREIRSGKAEDGEEGMALRERMSWHRSHGNNIVISVEAFDQIEEDEKTWEFLKEVSAGWNIVFVVTYRHYFEWVTSRYSQDYAHNKFDNDWSEDRPSLKTYIQNRLDDKDQVHPSVLAYQKYRKHFDHVRLFNLYQEGALIKHFVCQMLPTAKQVCNDFTKDDDTIRRVSKPHSAAMIADTAYEKGFIHKEIKMHKRGVIQRIKTRLKAMDETFGDKFLTCLPNALEARLMKFSISGEEEVIRLISHDKSPQPSPFPSVNIAQSNHMELFKNASAAKKFCQFDPEKILENEEWVSFLSELK